MNIANRWRLPAAALLLTAAATIVPMATAQAAPNYTKAQAVAELKKIVHTTSKQKSFKVAGLLTETIKTPKANVTTVMSFHEYILSPNGNKAFAVGTQKGYRGKTLFLSKTFVEVVSGKESAIKYGKGKWTCSKGSPILPSISTGSTAGKFTMTQSNGQWVIVQTDSSKGGGATLSLSRTYKAAVKSGLLNEYDGSDLTHEGPRASVAASFTAKTSDFGGKMPKLPSYNCKK